MQYRVLWGFCLFGMLSVAYGAEVKIRQNADGDVVVYDARGTEATGQDLGEMPALKDLKLSGAQVTDATLQKLGTYTGLTSLSLDKTGLTDATLESQISQLSKLQQLFLAETEVTDAGVAKLPLARLTRLRLAGTKITDRALEQLAEAQKLQTLDVSNTGVTSAGVTALMRLSTLKLSTLTDVNFYATPVDDAACETLAGMSELVRLNLDNTAVTDAGVAKLAGLEKLEFLHLGRTVVTDGCVETLGALRNLKTLHVTRTRITPDGAARLQALLPACRIFAGDDWLPVRDTPNAPVRVILDTDIGGDIDDAFALAILHNIEKQGRCELLAVTLTNTHPATARYVKAFNLHFGHDVPIGAGRGRGDDRYLTSPLTKKRADGSFVYPQVPEDWKPATAVAVLRKTLAAAPDGSIVIAQVGFSSNLADLLDSAADEISPLSGKELVQRKVRLLSVMAGAFTFTTDKYATLAEWNVMNDVPAARRVFHDWPGEIVFSGFEVGDAIRLSVCGLHHDYQHGDHLVWDSYLAWCKACNMEPNHDRPTWDLTSVLFVLRPEVGRDYYTLSPRGQVTVLDDGQVRFTVEESGRHRCFLTSPEQNIRVQEAFTNLCSFPETR